MLLTTQDKSNKSIRTHSSARQDSAKQARYQILVLCTGNSARSVMAEALLNSMAGQFFHAYSAGSHPSGKVNSFALEQISPLAIGYQPRSKSWDEFAQADTVELDIVLTVCGNAAQEICPNFIGTPKRVHWGLPDPAAVTGSDDNIRRAFKACYRVFEWRIEQLVTLMAARPDADIVDVMVNLANRFPDLAEINEQGFTAIIQ
jgi:arsenate reductase (thioredoxin)